MKVLTVRKAELLPPRTNNWDETETEENWEAEYYLQNGAVLGFEENIRARQAEKGISETETEQKVEESGSTQRMR